MWQIKARLNVFGVQMPEFDLMPVLCVSSIVAVFFLLLKVEGI